MTGATRVICATVALMLVAGCAVVPISGDVRAANMVAYEEQ